MKMRCGIEIHQQLDTHKLFCSCPSILRNDPPKLEIKRTLHPVAGEIGEKDLAAEYEASKTQEFIYQAYDTTCLVELDEEPPHQINQEALEIALSISLLLNCEILPIVQIMRKTVIDGSNTSGFQRTLMIARNGWVETKEGKVRIKNVFLEEDAARLIEETPHVKVFRLDRLGIPLVEITTETDIKSPSQAREVALHIGDILRSCKVKRGIGTIRQDINLSIPNHPRVEIKGFQDIRMFIPVIENEIKRQQENLRKGVLNEEVRKANPDGTTSFLRPVPGAARMYPETDLPLLKISRDIIDKVKSTLPKLRSKIRKELKEKGLSEELIKLLFQQNKLDEFESLLKIINNPKFVAKVLLLFPKNIAEHEKIKNIDKILTLDVIESILHEVAKGNISPDDVKEVMSSVVKGKPLKEALKIEKADLSEIETEIAKLIKEKPGLTFGAYMGLIMQKFRGKISGREASQILKNLLES